MVVATRGGTGTSWRGRCDIGGYDVLAPDLPCEDDSASLSEYADAVIDAIDDRRDMVVAGQSYGDFTAPLVADRVPLDVLVLVAGMIPAPGEAPADWWDNTGYREAVQEQARRDGGKTGSEEPFVVFYHDVPRALAEEAPPETLEPLALRLACSVRAAAR